MADSLSRVPVHLGEGARAYRLPEFDGSMEWYATYDEFVGDDGPGGRLVSLHTFTESWDSWEVHPEGHEVVVCTAGEITLIQEHLDGTVQSTLLGAGEYAINEPGVWHTADVTGSATTLFITAGEGTDHRARV